MRTCRNPDIALPEAKRFGALEDLPKGTERLLRGLFGRQELLHDYISSSACMYIYIHKTQKHYILQVIPRSAPPPSLGILGPVQEVRAGEITEGHEGRSLVVAYPRL